MPLTIELLGRGSARRDDTPVDGVRGQKAWALLAYLLLTDAPPSRERLARLFFPDAADPGGALRWNLSQLRRNLGIKLDGDPVRTQLPPDCVVDVRVLSSGTGDDVATLEYLGEELVAGFRADDNPDLDVWLESVRRHVDALSADLLREAAVGCLSRGDAGAAVRHAQQVVALEPLDENAHVLLVGCLRDAGRTEEARAAAEAARSRLRDELGVEPTAALWSAAHVSHGGPLRRSGTAGVVAQLEAGEAAIAAGAVDAGLDALRGALGGARALDDAHLLARSLTGLGSALIHAVRGSDQDALALLHEAAALAEDVGDRPLASTALRELGYVEFLRARYERADVWFQRAERVADDDAREVAWIATFAGARHTDVADYNRAAATLARAVTAAESADDPRALAMALSMRGRLSLLQGDIESAAGDLDRALATANRAGWRSFVPWPEALHAETLYLAGDLERARGGFEHAYALAQQVADPCWESMALRGLGVVSVASGRPDEAYELLRQAPRACRRFPDTWLWIEAYGLAALADLAVARGLDDAPSSVQILDDMATAHGMRELSRQAARYRVALGDSGAEELLDARSA